MEKNVQGLMKKTKKELIEIILRKDDEEKNLSNSLNDFVKRCDDLRGKLNTSVKDCEGMTSRINDMSAENNKLKEDLIKANENVFQHQRGMDTLTTEKEELERELYFVNKKKATLFTWCWILGAALILVGIMTLLF